jgi:AcrR family transcriptional regulator
MSAAAREPKAEVSSPAAAVGPAADASVSDSGNRAAPSPTADGAPATDAPEPDGGGARRAPGPHGGEAAPAASGRKSPAAPPSSSPPPVPSPAPTRRRGALLEEAILEAARAELAEHGYLGLTMEGVAARAQTSKPVVYRRWPSRAKLAVAAILRGDPGPADLPDTGALRTDLLAVLRIVPRRLEGLPRHVVFGLLADTMSDPEQFQLIQQQLTGQIQELVGRSLRRAVARGEISGERLTPRAVRAPADLIRSEIYLRGAAPSDAFIVETVDDVLIPLFKAF